MKKLTFDEVICNARIRENQLYFMVFGEKNFKVNRRSKDRLHLTCSRKETPSCIFSIRCSMSTNGNVMMRELKQTHSCSLKLRSKLSERETAQLISSTRFCQLSNSNYQYAFPTEIKYDSPIETNEIKISSAYRDDNLGRSASSSNFVYPTQENLSSQYIITSAARSNNGNTSRSASSDLDDYSVVGSDSDFVYPTQENLSSQNIITSAARCSDGNTSRSSSSDLDSVPRSDSDFVYPSQENLSSQNIITSAARCSDGKTSRSASSDLDYSVPGDSSIDSNRSTNYTNLTRIMAIFDSLNLSSEQKVHLSSSLNSLLQHQFGLPFVRELYISYDAVHREKMITDLCMLRSLYRKDINLWIPRSFASEGPVKSPCSKKRKFFYSEFEDDGDSVTYLDKLTYKN